MTARIIDGKAFAAGLRAKVQEEAAKLKAAHGIVPGLATVLVGNDPASEVYVRNKGKTAEAIGFKSFHYSLPENASEAEVLTRVKALNDDKAVHGILVQMPMPKQIREAAVLDLLDPAKDVDALTPYNAGLLMSGRARLVSCTPRCRSRCACWTSRIAHSASVGCDACDRVPASRAPIAQSSASGK